MTLLFINSQKHTAADTLQLLAFSCLTLLLSGCASQQAPNSTNYWSNAAITQSLDKAGLDPAQVSLYIAPLQRRDSVNNPISQHEQRHSPQPLASYQSTLALAPASTMKLVTSAVALDVLGPRWQGETRLSVSQMPNQQGVLTTPLYLQGFADVDFDAAALFQLLEQLRSQGVRQLAGSVVLDRNHWQDQHGTTADPWVTPFDESPRRRYNHNPDVLALSQQMLTMQLDTRGQQASMQSYPRISGLSINAQLHLTNAPCDSLSTDDWQIIEQMPTNTETKPQQPALLLTVQGQAPKGCQWPLTRAWLSRKQLLPLLFRHYWQLLGGSFTTPAGAADFVDGVTPANTIELAKHQSRPLGQLVQQLNKISDNSLSRTLFLELGATGQRQQIALTAGCGHSTESGHTDTLTYSRALVCQWLQARDIDSRGLVLETGAGLSRTERISAATLAALIRHASSAAWYPDWLASLPRSGIDGTLQQRLLTVADRARLKTGTLNNATGLAGVVWDKQQQPYIFVGIVNGPVNPMLVTTGRQWLDAQVQLLANSGAD